MFNQICQEHSREFNKSAISPELAALNFTSIPEGDEAYEYLLYSEKLQHDRRNDGRLRDGMLRRYSHLIGGGWWCAGIDLINGGDSQWGCLKPNTPYLDMRDEHKQIKYEHPPKEPTGVFALKVDLASWQRISDRYNIAFDAETDNFWAWIIAHPKLPINICEGAKKAACLLSNGYVAIALPGVTGAVKSVKDAFGNKVGKPYLIPELQLFLQKDREFYITFDNDKKDKTIANVNREINKLGFLLIQGKCKASVVTWSDIEDKGCDDLIAHRGIKYFDNCVEKRKNLENWELSQILNLKRFVNLEVNQKYCDFSFPNDEKFIAIKSAKGTGKTEIIATNLEEVTRRGDRILALTHRVQLGTELCRRFGVEYVTDIFKKNSTSTLGYGLCVDSLHAESQARFSVEEWEGAYIVIDEVEQVLWHLFNSPTCKKNRVEIIENLRKVIRLALSTGGKLIIADADLSSVSLNYFKRIINEIQLEDEVEIDSDCHVTIKPFIIENKYKKATNRNLIAYMSKNPSEMWFDFCSQLREGKVKQLFHTSGQKHDSTWGAQTLERITKRDFPHLKILRIDAETVAEPGHPAFGCMANLNAIVQLYDVVFASPVIETGVSIDIPNWFDGVWSISWGIQTVDSICQSIERYRGDCTRFLWAKEMGLGTLKVGNGSTSVKSLLKGQHQHYTQALGVFSQVGMDNMDFEDSLNCPFLPELSAWGLRGCLINSGYWDYRNSILSKLIADGYKIIGKDDLDKDEQKAIKNDVKAARDENCTEYRDAVCAVEIIEDEKEFKKLKDKRTKTENERLVVRKTDLHNRFGGVFINHKLVEMDDKGCYSEMRLHYFLTVGREFLADRDKGAVSAIAKHGKIFTPDFNKSILTPKIIGLDALGIATLLDEERDFTAENLAEWFENIKKYADHIFKLYGFKIRKTAIQCANQFLNLFGLALKRAKRLGNNAGRAILYKLEMQPFTHQIFDGWLQKDAAARFAKEQYQESIPSNPNNIMELDRINTEERLIISNVYSGFFDVIAATGASFMNAARNLYTMVDGLSNSLRENILGELAREFPSEFEQVFNPAF
jgi:hypothetical protein